MLMGLMAAVPGTEPFVVKGNPFMFLPKSHVRDMKNNYILGTNVYEYLIFLYDCQG